MPRVGKEYPTKHGTLLITSWKTSKHEKENYGAKNRMYFVHVVPGNDYFFLGRFFSLKKAREFVLTY